MIRKSRCMHSAMVVLRRVTKSDEPFSLTRLCNVACYYTDSPFAPGDFTGSTRSCRLRYFPALTKDTSGSLSTYQSSFIDILVFILHDTPPRVISNPSLRLKLCKSFSASRYEL